MSCSCGLMFLEKLQALLGDSYSNLDSLEEDVICELWEDDEFLYS